MAGVERGAHQRFVFRWAFGTALVMRGVPLITSAAAP
jgi:CitMHS family citrate-Mg2+:H+ or citrate-Ca2+:H+ symporter